MNDLRNALHDLADSEPLAPLDSDLWARGRSARRAHSVTRLQLAAACLVLLAVVVGLVSLGRSWTTAEPAFSPSEVPDGGALPAVVHSPEGRADEWRPEDGAHGDLAPSAGFEKIGRASAVLARPNLLPVIVSAEDGRHWLPVLPLHTADNYAGSFPVKVSPDGWKLAYTWVAAGETTAKTQAGLAVVDLRSGDVSRVALTGRNRRPIRVDEISWSPDGEHIGWLGDEAVAWTDRKWSSLGRDIDVGVSSLDSLKATSFEVEEGRQGNDAIAVTNTGRLFYIAGTRLWAFDDDGAGGAWALEGVEESAWSTAIVDDAGQFLVVGHNGTGYAGSSASGLVYLDLASSGVDGPVVGTFERWEGSAGSPTAPLGFTPDGSLVVSVERQEDLEPGSVSVQAKDISGRIRTLTQGPAGAQSSVSIATDLADQPVIEFPEPDWPMSDERRALLVALAVACVLLPIWLVVRLRRRRRSP